MTSRFIILLATALVATAYADPRRDGAIRSTAEFNSLSPKAQVKVIRHYHQFMLSIDSGKERIRVSSLSPMQERWQKIWDQLMAEAYAKTVWDAKQQSSCGTWPSRGTGDHHFCFLPGEGKSSQYPEMKDADEIYNAWKAKYPGKCQAPDEMICNPALYGERLDILCVKRHPEDKLAIITESCNKAAEVDPYRIERLVDDLVKCNKEPKGGIEWAKTSLCGLFSSTLEGGNAFCQELCVKGDSENLASCKETKRTNALSGPEKKHRGFCQLLYHRIKEEVLALEGGLDAKGMHKRAFKQYSDTWDGPSGKLIGDECALNNNYSAVTLKGVFQLSDDIEKIINDDLGQDLSSQLLIVEQAGSKNKQVHVIASTHKFQQGTSILIKDRSTDKEKGQCTLNLSANYFQCLIDISWGEKDPLTLEITAYAQNKYQRAVTSNELSLVKGTVPSVSTNIPGTDPTASGSEPSTSTNIPGTDPTASGSEPSTSTNIPGTDPTASGSEPSTSTNIPGTDPSTSLSIPSASSSIQDQGGYYGPTPPQAPNRIGGPTVIKGQL